MPNQKWWMWIPLLIKTVEGKNVVNALAAMKAKMNDSKAIVAR
jgi:hypothetical protein